MIVERQAVQWVDGSKKTGGDGSGSDDRRMKSAGDGTIIERGTPQLDVQELGQEQQLTLHEHDETQEAFDTDSDNRGMKSAGGGTVVGRRGALQLEVQELELEQQPASSLELRKEVQEAPPDPEQGTLEAPSDPEEETLEAPSDPNEKTKYAAGLAGGPTDLEGPVVPASRKRAIGGNLPPNNLKAHVEPAGARRRGRRSTAKFSADGRGRQRGECVDVRRRGHDVFFRGKWSYRTR